MNNRILIVDDDPEMLQLLRRILEKEYSIRVATSGDEALNIASAWLPDVVLLDLLMPGRDGYDTCQQLKSAFVDSPPQVIIVSSSSGAEDFKRAFDSGADDFFVKPVRSCDLLSRMQLLLRLRAALSQSNNTLRVPSWDTGSNLAESLTGSATDIGATQDIAVYVMTKLAEARDNETGDHMYRLRDYSLQVVRELRASSKYAHQIDDEFLTDLYRSSPLHDIGKVGVPDRILQSTGRLTAGEFDVMKQHTTIGAGILWQAAQQSNAGRFLHMGAQIARSHHERWDGQGYPDGLAGTKIPLAARIVSATDVYDALTSERPYKPAWPSKRACEYIVERAGSHFDPEVSAAFERCFPIIKLIQRQHSTQKVKKAEIVAPHLAVVAAS